VNRSKLHVFGASGTGTTTLGRALADVWSVPHADTDDYYWEPTVPPFSVQRAEAERLRLMDAVFLHRDAWVLSGSLMGWGNALSQRFDAAVFLTLDESARLDRLGQREARRRSESDAFNDHDHRAFMDAAASYDEPKFDGRSRQRHDEWMRGLSCPVLRLDSAESVNSLVDVVLCWDPGA
jgi:adenylate kinase family enzyme